MEVMDACGDVLMVLLCPLDHREVVNELQNNSRIARLGEGFSHLLT